MMNLWYLILMWFCPRIDSDATEVDDPTADEEISDEEDESIDEDAIVDDEPPEKPVSRAQKEIISLRERAQKAEDDHRRAIAELAEARRPQQAAQPDHEQTLTAQEEAILKNPESTDWQRYAVQSARDARTANRNASQAVHEARDIADRAEFNTLKTTSPKAYEKYKDKVEELKKQNPNAPRMELYALAMGRDMRDGKLKNSDVPAAKPKSGVPRGNTPGVRSNVSASGNGRSAVEAARKRLEGKRI